MDWKTDEGRMYRRATPRRQYRVKSRIAKNPKQEGEPPAVIASVTSHSFLGSSHQLIVGARVQAVHPAIVCGYPTAAIPVASSTEYYQDAVAIPASEVKVVPEQARKRCQSKEEDAVAAVKTEGQSESNKRTLKKMRMKSPFSAHRALNIENGLAALLNAVAVVSGSDGLKAAGAAVCAASSEFSEQECTDTDDYSDSQSDFSEGEEGEDASQASRKSSSEGISLASTLSPCSISPCGSPSYRITNRGAA